MTPQPVKPRILVVDDHPANRMAFLAVLEDSYSVYLAESGEEALEFVLQQEFAVILLDVRMPDLDGHETAKLLRRRERARYTPIIFMSAHDKTLADMTKGYGAGATDYIVTPVEPEFLRFKVRAFADLYLKNESLRIQIHQLTSLVQSLQAQLHEAVPNRAGVDAKVREVEEAIGVLRRQVIGISA